SRSISTAVSWRIVLWGPNLRPAAGSNKREAGLRTRLYARSKPTRLFIRHKSCKLRCFRLRLRRRRTRCGARERLMRTQSLPTLFIAALLGFGVVAVARAQEPAAAA